MTEDEKTKIEPEFNRALALWRDGGPREALDALKKLRRRFPDDGLVLCVIAAVYHSLGNGRQMLANAKKAARLLPASETASVMLFHALVSTERFAEAAAEMKRFLTAFSKDHSNLREYNLLIEEWKQRYEMETDDYREIVDRVFRDALS